MLHSPWSLLSFIFCRIFGHSCISCITIFWTQRVLCSENFPFWVDRRHLKDLSKWVKSAIVFYLGDFIDEITPFPIDVCKCIKTSLYICPDFTLHSGYFFRIWGAHTHYISSRDPQNFGSLLNILDCIIWIQEMKIKVLKSTQNLTVFRCVCIDLGYVYVRL